MSGLSARARRRQLRKLHHRDVVATREGWLVDLAGPDRLAALRALAEDPSPEVEDALLDTLADPLDDVRAEAVRCMERRGSAAALDRCVAAAPGWDPARYPASRQAAWVYLGACGSTAQVDSFTSSLLLAAPLPHIDDAAIAALKAMIGDDHAASRLALERAASAFGHVDPDVVARATQLAGRFGAADPAPIVAALADDRCAVAACDAAGRIGDLKFCGRLAALLDAHRPTAVRAAAATALGALGGHEAAWHLQAVVDDEDPVVRRAATEALIPLAAIASSPAPPLSLPPAMMTRAEAAGRGVVHTVVAEEEFVAEDEFDEAEIDEIHEDPVVDAPADDAHREGGRAMIDDERDLVAEDDVEDRPETEVEVEPEVEAEFDVDEEPEARADDQPLEPMPAMAQQSRAPFIAPRPTSEPAALHADSNGGGAAVAQAVRVEELEEAPDPEPALAEPVVAVRVEDATEGPPDEVPQATAAELLVHEDDDERVPDPPTSRWLHDHPPAVSEPPPRPRGARRRAKRRT